MKVTRDELKRLDDWENKYRRKHVRLAGGKPADVYKLKGD